MAAPLDPPPWDYCLRKYLLLLATLVATVTYSVGFSPPGGTWPDSPNQKNEHIAGVRDIELLAGDPIIRHTDYVRYMVFFYCNAAAFGASLVVIVLILLLAMMHEKGRTKLTLGKMLPLRVVMVLDMISLLMAYAAGTCRDRVTIIYSGCLAGAVVVYLIYHVWAAMAGPTPMVQNRTNDEVTRDERQRKVLMLLAMFAVSVTYGAGIAPPGGFWESTEERSHSAGDAMLADHHEARLRAFFICNTTAFVASLFVVVLLLGKKLGVVAHLSTIVNGCIIVGLIGLVAAYAGGSSRMIQTTVYVICLIVAVLVCILLLWKMVVGNYDSIEKIRTYINSCFNRFSGSGGDDKVPDAVEKARSLVLLLATLALTITYQAGLQPPGGFWKEDEKLMVDDAGEMMNPKMYIAGDPILETMHPKRYKAFYYCNSLAFVASLVAIILIQKKLLLKHHVLEAAMILDLFGLIGAYAIGTCRDVSSSIYVMAIAGAVLVYVVVHVIFFTLDHKLEEQLDSAKNEQVEKRRKRLLLFAILAATITYQAGMTPPGAFITEKSTSSGDPVLLHNDPPRYMVFFYCNSVSFMLSIALILLLVNPNLYKPAIQSYALSVCTAAGLFCLIGAYAAGSTQHRSTTISIVVLVAVVILILFLLHLVFKYNGWNKIESEDTTNPAASTSDPEAGASASATAITVEFEQEKNIHSKRKYLMLLGILVASVTYQAGLQPPGGTWQEDDGDDGYLAGNPVMRDKRKLRYVTFFYSNSTSLVASIVVILLLLHSKMQKENWWFRVMNMAIVLDLLALLVAYATGSSRERARTARVAALVLAVLGYFVVHLVVSRLSKSKPNGNN